MDEYVIKAQILAGGRGKGVFDSGFKGGVHLTKEWDFYVYKPISVNFMNLSKTGTEKCIKEEISLLWDL